MNWNYDATRDGVTPAKEARLTLNLAVLGVSGAMEARWFSPGVPPVALPVQRATVTVPELGLGAVLELRAK